MLQIVFIIHNVTQTLELGETSVSYVERDQLKNERYWVDLRMRTSSRLFWERVNISKEMTKNSWQYRILWARWGAIYLRMVLPITLGETEMTKYVTEGDSLTDIDTIRGKHKKCYVITSKAPKGGGGCLKSEFPACWCGQIWQNCVHRWFN